MLSASRDPRVFASSVFFEAGAAAGKRWRAELPLHSWIGRSLRLADDVRPEPIYRLDLSPDTSLLSTLPSDL